MEKIETSTSIICDSEIVVDVSFKTLRKVTFFKTDLKPMRAEYDRISGDTLFKCRREYQLSIFNLNLDLSKHYWSDSSASIW
uniref:Uncharacterized protein n=1 Tax=Glossina palpalis gambiensis TaxID=67801 RepID=A0A1B0AVW3_9MUSC